MELVGHLVQSGAPKMAKTIVYRLFGLILLPKAGCNFGDQRPAQLLL
jgi:hypothetical protein